MKFKFFILIFFLLSITKSFSEKTTSQSNLAEPYYNLGWKNLENEYKRKGYTTSEIRERVMRKKAEEAQKLLFEPIVKNVTTKRKASGEGLLKGQKQITSFFTKRGK